MIIGLNSSTSNRLIAKSSGNYTVSDERRPQIKMFLSSVFSILPIMGENK